MQNQNDPSPRTSHSQPIGNLTNAILKNAETSALTSSPSPSNSETTISPAPPSSQTGMRLSLPGSETLRSLAAQARDGVLVSDESLQESLQLAFGSRLVTRKNWRRVYDENGNGYEEVLDGYVVKVTGLKADEVKIIDALEFFNRAVQSEQVSAVTGMLTRMRVSMLRRNESDSDVEMLVDTALSICVGYPFDIVMFLTDKWLKSRKFFPLPVEMVEELDAAVALRRALEDGFRRAGGVAIASDGNVRALPPRKHRNDRAQATWTAQDWEEHILDATKMVELARQNPTMFNEASWSDEVSRRMQKRSEAFPNG